MNSTVSYTCVFSNPRRFDGTQPDNYGHQWQYTGETCTYNNSVYAPTTSIATSTDIAIYASMTAGEILMIMFMFILIIIEMIKLLARSLDRIKTKKTFLAYGKGDVEIREDL